MNSWRFFEGSSTSAIVRRQRPASGQVMTATPTTTWTGCIFSLACHAWSMSKDCTTTYRVTTCATATRLSLVVWHLWQLLVRYNNRRRRRRVDQNNRSFLFFFFHFQSKNSAETWNNRSPRSKGTLWSKKIRNLSPPKIALLIGPCLPYRVLGFRSCALGGAFTYYLRSKSKYSTSAVSYPERRREIEDILVIVAAFD